MPANACLPSKFFLLRKMVTDLRTDSLDYRTELLSPDVTGEAVTMPTEAAWRLNMDGFKLPDRNKDSYFGFGSFVESLRRQRKIAEYYKRQNKLLKGFNELDLFSETGFWPGSLTEDEVNQLARNERIAIYASNVANLVLFLAKVYASFESRSLAVIASTLDSLLDLLSGFILWFTSNAMRKPNQYRYPIGKNRMQPVGIVVFASVMATLGLQILFESGRQLLTKAQPDRDPVKEKWMIGIMVSATVVKFVLMAYCRRFKNEIVRAYAQDHLFDVITNGIGLASAVLAIRFYWWIDPVGAIIIALYTMGNWAKTVMENVWSLIGKTAPAEYLAKLTYLIWNHDKEIQHIETVRAYTFGCNYFVEVDIVLPGDMSLSHAHNIGETLQEKLEVLPEVERAFVHVDFDITHRPEHKPKLAS
ncbi:Cation efflux family protein [Prunus dulcis]|uniref:Cation efflux family protein n=2 Tax=Prunus dulcis TaxID=3755 RepID=A0A4Y1RB81_PRUDU|nr:Cation efflux family protein [Prunus dulcis]